MILSTGSIIEEEMYHQTEDQDHASLPEEEINLLPEKHPAVENL